MKEIKFENKNKIFLPIFFVLPSKFLFCFNLKLMKNGWIANILSVTLDLEVGPVIEEILGSELTDHEKKVMFAYLFCESI
jgi:hypothetical protein